jgi:hypothetical protein
MVMLNRLLSTSRYLLLLRSSTLWLLSQALHHYRQIKLICCLVDIDATKEFQKVISPFPIIHPCQADDHVDV